MAAGSSSSGVAQRQRFVNVATAITATGGLLFGYDTGVISGALLFIRQGFDLTTFPEGVIVAFLLVGAMIGAFSGGPLSDGDDSSALSAVLATACLGLYIASFAISLGPVFWLMISETTL